jgi:hypothetical protein
MNDFFILGIYPDLIILKLESELQCSCHFLFALSEHCHRHILVELPEPKSLLFHARTYTAVGTVAIVRRLDGHDVIFANDMSA